MKTILLGLALLGAAAGPTLAQNNVQAPANPVGPGTRNQDNTPGSPAVQTDRTRQESGAQAPIPGANSFTEGQARSRIEGAGYTGVTGLHKDDQGIWRGTAMRGGQQHSVALDYQGNVTGQ